MSDEPVVNGRAKTSVFIATSLDGFISRPDGSIDWLNEKSAAVPAGEDAGYGQFMAGIDALVMGRSTFEQVLSFGQWPYGEKRMVVLSRKGVKIPEHLAPTVSTSPGPPERLLADLAAEGVRHIYVDGGRTIQSFLRAGLIDELTITVIPVLLGEGRPLFGPLEADADLELIRSTVYSFGFVQHTWRVRRDG